MHYFNIACAPHTFEHLKPTYTNLQLEWNRHEVYHTQDMLDFDYFPHLLDQTQKDRYIIFFNHPLAVKSYFTNLQRMLTPLDSAARQRHLAAQLNHVYIFPGLRSRMEFDRGFTALASHFKSMISYDIDRVYRFTPAGQEQMGVRQGLRSFWQEMLITQYSNHPSLPYDPNNPCKALLNLVQANPDYTWQGIAYTNSASQFDYAGVWQELANNLEDLLDDLNWEAYERTPTYFQTDVLKHLVAHAPRLELTTVPCYTNQLDSARIEQLGLTLRQQALSLQASSQDELLPTFTQQGSRATTRQLSYLKSTGLWQGSWRYLLLGEFKILTELCSSGASSTSLQAKYENLLELGQDYIFLISSNTTLQRLQDFFEFADYVQTVVSDKFNTHKVQLTRATGRVEYMDYATPSCHQVNYETRPQAARSGAQGVLQLSEPASPTSSSNETQVGSTQEGNLFVKTSLAETLQDLGQRLYPHGIPSQTLAHIYEFTPSAQVTLAPGKKLPVFISLNLNDSTQLEQLISKLPELRMLHIHEI